MIWYSVICVLFAISVLPLFSPVDVRHSHKSIGNGNGTHYTKFYSQPSVQQTDAEKLQESTHFCDMYSKYETDFVKFFPCYQPNWRSLKYPNLKRIRKGNYAMRTYGGIAPPFLPTALDGEWWASRFCRFTAGERVLGINCVGGSTADLEAVENRQISWPCPESNPNFSAVQHVARRYTDCLQGNNEKK
jgi:hypothetical protein